MKPNLPANAATASAPTNPELLVRQFGQIDQFCKENGIKRIETTDGMCYSRNTRTGVTVLAAAGAIVTENQHTTTVTYLNQGSTGTQGMHELHTNNPGVSQQMLGAFNGGKSQPWVSKKLSGS